MKKFFSKPVLMALITALFMIAVYETMVVGTKNGFLEGIHHGYPFFMFATALFFYYRLRIHQERIRSYKELVKDKKIPTKTPSKSTKKVKK